MINTNLSGSITRLPLLPGLPMTTLHRSIPSIPNNDLYRDVLRSPGIIPADQSRLSQTIIPRITQTDIYPILYESIKSLGRIGSHVPSVSLGPIIADPTSDTT